MNTNTNTPVTYTHRIRANDLVRINRIEGNHLCARVLEAAIMWESFPNLHSAEQLALANALLVTEQGTHEWNLIAHDIFTIIG